MASNFSKSIQAPLVYVNQVGGQDELVFDGNSFVIDREKVLFQAKHFNEEYKKIEVSPSNEIIIDESELKKTDNSDEVYSALILGLRDYVSKNKFPGVVVGISGGIDSAVVAALASHALGGAAVYGVSMPSKFSSEHSKKDAELLSNNLGIDFKTIPIQNLVDCFENSLVDFFSDTNRGTAEENIQSRVRGNILMALSNKFRRLVLSTGNKTELALGYLLT